MTLGPMQPLRPFMVGYRRTKSCKCVTGKLKTHLQILLKNLTWSDNDNNMFLGPVVVVQQVLDPPLRLLILNSKKRGGGGGAHSPQPSLQESKSQGLGIWLPVQDVTVRSFIYHFCI